MDAALRSNPREHFWQFRFSGEETKNGDQVHAILPRQLIGPLETYLTKCRPLLMGDYDPETLFVKDDGRPFPQNSFAGQVGKITRRWAGRRVTPHLFRDIFAVKFLKDRPRDYLTLSKILWHRNLKTTLQLYGANFDASYGALGAEEWLDDRESSKRTRG